MGRAGEQDEPPKSAPLREAIAQANRAEAAARRAARAAHQAEQECRHPSTLRYISETPAEKRQRLAGERKERERQAAIRKANPSQAFVDQHVAPAAQRHGIYRQDTVPGPNIIQGGEEKPTSIEVVRNRGGTTIERWHARGSLSGDQLDAIERYQAAYRMFWGTPPRVTAKWSLAAGGTASGASEENVHAKMRAKKTLDLIDNEVFFGKSLDSFEVWQNVVIFDEAAGRAGSRLGFRNDGAEAAAKAVVLMLASEIAIALRSRPAREAER